MCFVYQTLPINQNMIYNNIILLLQEPTTHVHNITNNSQKCTTNVMKHYNFNMEYILDNINSP